MVLSFIGRRECSGAEATLEGCGPTVQSHVERQRASCHELTFAKMASEQFTSPEVTSAQKTT